MTAAPPVLSAEQEARGEDEGLPLPRISHSCTNGRSCLFLQIQQFVDHTFMFGILVYLLLFFSFLVVL
jgi:hypothetical protein